MNQTISTSRKNNKRELPVVAAGVVLAAFVLLFMLFANWGPAVVEEPPVVQNEGVTTELDSEQYPVWQPYEERHAPNHAGETADFQLPLRVPH